MKRHILTGLLFACATLAPVSAQEAQERGLPVLSTQDLVIAHYEPENVDAEELLEVAQRLVGRHFCVKERGGHAAPPVMNLQLLGYSVLVYDDKASVESILQSLRSLDGADRPESRRPASAPVQEREFRPRFVRLDTIKDLLRPTVKKVPWRGEYVPSYSLIEERSLVILRGQPDELQQTLALLASVDVPQPEIRLQCLLLMPGKSPNGGQELPEELQRELKALVPQYEFERVGFALLHTSVSPSSRLRALLGEVDGKSYELSFRPIAFDGESGSLSVEECQLVRSPVGGDSGRQSIFSTNMVMRGGQYTVLGASGTAPVFVVVRIEPL